MIWYGYCVIMWFNILVIILVRLGDGSFVRNYCLVILILVDYVWENNFLGLIRII